ncbi:MAG: DUF1844 domain-containing protein [Pirellulales bacterium]
MSHEEKQPQIIVDEDWKAQAQAEKEVLSKGTPPKEEAAQEASPSAESPTDTGKQPAAASVQGRQSRGAMPPANFTQLITMLATQSMAALGQIAIPGAGESEVDLPFARHFIDTLQMLEEKTRGNLSAEESGLLSSLLHELRMAYVAMRNKDQKPPG